MKQNRPESTVGIVGVGLMGLGIATSIQRHHWSLNILDHAGNQPIDGLVKNGAGVYSSVRELGENSDIIILCVTGTPEVEEVISGKAGLIDILGPGKTVIDCSTAIPGATIKLAKLAENTGAEFLDAPMTRTPKEAMEGRLNLIVGGNQRVLERHLGLLQCFAENITHAGPVGNGHKLKLLHNFVSIGFSTLLAEATACARKAGVSDDILLDVLAKGGGAGVILDRFQPYIKTGDDSQFRFSLINSFKDIGYYNAMAEDLQASQLVAKAVHGLLTEACETGHEQDSLPGMIAILEDNYI